MDGSDLRQQTQSRPVPNHVQEYAFVWSFTESSSSRLWSPPFIFSLRTPVQVTNFPHGQPALVPYLINLLRISILQHCVCMKWAHVMISKSNAAISLLKSISDASLFPGRRTKSSARPTRPDSTPACSAHSVCFFLSLNSFSCHSLLCWLFSLSQTLFLLILGYQRLLWAAIPGFMTLSLRPSSTVLHRHYPAIWLHILLWLVSHNHPMD